MVSSGFICTYRSFLGRQSSRAEFCVEELFRAALGQREHSWLAHFQPLCQENDHAMLYALFEHGGVLFANDFDSVGQVILPNTPSDSPVHGTVIRVHTSLSGPVSVSDTDPLEVKKRYIATLKTVNSIKGPIVEELARLSAQRNRMGEKVHFVLIKKCFAPLNVICIYYSLVLSASSS
jgi:hypothetical protein